MCFLYYTSLPVVAVVQELVVIVSENTLPIDPNYIGIKLLFLRPLGPFRDGDPLIPSDNLRCASHNSNSNKLYIMAG